MNKILIWDLPTRIFHWALAASFIGAFGISNLVDDDSVVFKIHMLLGALMAFMVMLRIIWGFLGSRYARFGSFAFGPGAVLAYIKGTVSGDGERHLGHNPGSSVAIWAMFALTFGLALTGANMASFEILKDVHEIFAYAFMAVVVAHVAGVAWHSLRHKENITLSMVSGYKDGDAASGISSAHPLAALVFVVLVGSWGAALVSNYDAAAQTVTVPFIGKVIQLGEAEHGEKGDHHEGRDDHDDD